MMASAMRTGANQNQPVSRGLTLQDYWHRPVPARLQAAINQNAEPARQLPTAPGKLPARRPDELRAPAAPSDPGVRSALRKEINQAAQTAAHKYGLPAGLVTSVIRHESNFNPRAVSSAGARGLMQLMPATARELGVDDAFDIQQNIDGGARYLKQMLAQFDGDVRKALAAYNAGPGTVRRYGGVPPYPETRRYVRKVMASAAETV